MTLQDRLVELVAMRGAQIVDDPAEFRAALDDYLTDEEITPGNRNVLTDAVRLGAVRRLLDLLDHGSDPRSAVAEAGTALANERGSDDPRRSMRATALMGFAVGRLDVGVLQSFPEVASAGAAPPPPPPLPPVSPVAPSSPAPPPFPAGPVDSTPPDLGPTRVVPTGREQAGGSSGGRGRLPAIAIGVVLLLVVAGTAIWWFAIRGPSPEDAVDEWFDSGSCEEMAERSTGTAQVKIQEQIDLGDGDGLCTNFSDYSWEYAVTSSEERGDRATVEVEGTLHYDGPLEDTSDETDFTTDFDLRLVDDEWLVSNVGLLDGEE